MPFNDDDMPCNDPIRYPVMMAERDKVMWAVGAEPGAVLMQSHDLHLLQMELQQGGFQP